MENLAALVRPDAGTEAVAGVIGAFHRFFRRAEGEDTQDRAEDFLPRDAVAGGDLGEETRRKKETFARQRTGGLEQFRPFPDTALHQFTDFIELRPAVDGPDVGILVQGIADPEGAEPVAQFAHHDIMHAFLHQQPASRAADVALVEIDALDDAFHCLVERCVGEDDVGGLPAEFERELFGGSGHGAGDLFPDFGGPGEGDFIDPGVVHEGCSGGAGPGQDIHHPVRQTGFLTYLCKVQGGQRRGFGGLEDHRISAGERGGNFPRQHQQGEIPRDDLSRDSERARSTAGKGISQLVRPPGVVEKVGGDERQIHVPAFPDGLATIHRFQHRQFAGFFLNQPGDPEEIFATIGSGGFGPDFFVGAAGGPHRTIHVGGAGFRDAGEWFFRGRIDRFEGPAIGSPGPFSIDEKPIFGPDHGFYGFWSRRVVPTARKIEWGSRLAGRPGFGGAFYSGFHLNGRALQRAAGFHGLSIVTFLSARTKK